MRLFVYFWILISFCFNFQACFPKKPSPLREVSFMEAQGLLNNDFAVVITIESSLPKELKGGTVFEILKSDLLLSEIQTRNIPKSKELLLYSSDPSKVESSAKTLQEQGYRVGILK